MHHNIFQFFQLRLRLRYNIPENWTKILSGILQDVLILLKISKIFSIISKILENS